VVDFYATREKAEETLQQVVEDEPGWASVLEVVQSSSGRRPRTRRMTS
jgi:hypothetical protein